MDEEGRSTRAGDRDDEENKVGYQEPCHPFLLEGIPGYGPTGMLSTQAVAGALCWWFVTCSSAPTTR